MLQKNGTVVVNNLPAIHYRYVVAKVHMGALWYWTSWDSEDAASENIRENKMEDHAIVIDMEDKR
ncbi:MAG: hypothetical protein J6M66_13835 [Lachnospiraceae bacterium]|nr:hypothetical protein [Lachnospiraceae bacterium]